MPSGPYPGLRTPPENTTESICTCFYFAPAKSLASTIQCGSCRYSEHYVDSHFLVRSGSTVALMLMCKVCTFVKSYRSLRGWLRESHSSRVRMSSRVGKGVTDFCRMGVDSKACADRRRTRAGIMSTARYCDSELHQGFT